MRIVQSLWSAPAKGASIEESRVKGGWLSEKYYHYSMALSCALLRQWYPQVELVTDEAGARLLVEQLQLPYSRVTVALDHLNQYPEGLWSLPKLHTYSLQQSPFLHVDGDVFTWKPFKVEQLGKSFLLVQSPELEHHETYAAPLRHFQTTLQGLPASLQPAATQAPVLTAVNAGVLGGTDVEFLHDYAVQALRLIDQNKAQLAADSQAGFANTIIEQFFFKQLAESRGKKIHYLFDRLSKNFEEILQLDQVPVNATYIHVLGSAKRKYYNCLQVENRLRYHFPTLYKRINAFHQQQGLFQDQPSWFPEGNTLAPIYRLGWTDPGPAPAAPELLLYPGVVLHEGGEASVQPPAGAEDQPLVVPAPDSLELPVLATTLSELTEFGFAHVRRVYDFMASVSIPQLLSTAYTLADSAAIIEVPATSALHQHFATVLSEELVEDSESMLSVVSKISTGEAFLQPLVHWEQLLTYFQGEVLTGLELIQLIDENNPGEIPPRHIESLVFGFLCFHLVHTGNLRLADPVAPAPYPAAVPAQATMLVS